MNELSLAFNTSDYAALLFNAAAGSRTHSQATGRLYFRKKTLTYSFVTSNGFGRAKLLTFLDIDGNIIEEFPLQSTHFQEEMGKICGSWQRLPRRYRKQLRRDELYAQLTNEDGETISGKVAKHYGLRSELYSSLMSNEEHAGAATAIVSLDSQTGSVHVNLLMSGIFPADGEKNVRLEVTLEAKSPTETRNIVEEIIVPKVEQALTTVDFTTVVEEAELQALGQGRLSISVMPQHAPDLIVKGVVTPRFSCDIFDSILSTVDESNVEDEDGSGDARGLAWMTMTKSGLVTYHLNWHDLSENPVSIQIDNGRKSQRLLRIVHEMDYQGDKNGGWANGTFRMDSQDVDAFYHANLYINVATAGRERALRGRIVQNLLGLAQEFSRSPLLLVAENPASSSPRFSGLAWLNVDSTCRMHYQVRLHGVDKNTPSKILLEDHPMRNLKALNLVPGRQLDLQEFQGFEASGHQDSIHKLTMARMNSGDASLKVESNGASIEGRISADIKVPTECRPRFSRNDLEMMPGFLNDLGQEIPEAEKAYALKCVYEGQYHDDGSQWKATHEPCKMCSCQR